MLLLLILILYVGMYIFDDIVVMMMFDVCFVDDCDWYFEWLYGFVVDFGVLIFVLLYVCYVVDLNCLFDNENLYLG